MTAMAKKWYRSRRNQIIIFIVTILLIFYYMSLNNSVPIEPDLDLTRRHSRYLAVLPMPTISNAESVQLKQKLVLTPTTESYSKQINMNDRNSIIEYIESTLQEALKEDKGTGCEIPKLDPFAKEVTQFDKELPKVVCSGTDWVKCYLSECAVVREILETTKDITCVYKDIIYESDQKYTIGPPTKVYGEDVYVLKRSDHVKITCVGKHINSSLSTTPILPSKWTGHAAGFRSTVKPKPPPPGREDSLNVLILGFDTTSKNGFIRRMPQSYKVLTEEFNATIFNGYNIVGDGTPAALFPILTGKTELELPDVRKKKKNNGTLDSMPFIFYKLKDDGYRTAYFEDMPWIGTFQYRFNGWRHQPADHYLRAFYLEESSSGKRWWRGGRARYCVGDTPQYRLMLDLTSQFFNLDGKKFCFTFIADITHDDFNMISTADEDTANFLRRFRDEGRLEDTFLIVMGDHGPRFAYVRDTLQGKLEERLPLLAIYTPSRLANSRPEAVRALRSNTALLSTPHDLHATLLDVIGLREHANTYKVAGADLPRGLTLLEPLPHNRSCSEAGVEPHWCSCVAWATVAPGDPSYQRVVNAFMDYINYFTEEMRSKCVLRTLTSVEWVMRQKSNKNLLSFAGAKDADGYIGKFNAKTHISNENYQLKVVVGPGRGVYEAVVTYLVKEDQFRINTRDISRTNAYGNEPHCISETHPHLNMFCYCND